MEKGQKKLSEGDERLFLGKNAAKLTVARCGRSPTESEKDLNAREY